MALSDKKIRSLKPTAKKYKVSDDKGLFLLVKPSGGKYWKMAYRMDGKQKELSIGVYPDISLKLAREKRDEARTLVAQKKDPSEAKKQNKAAETIANENTFKQTALEWFEIKMSDKSQSHQDRTLRALEKDLFPQLQNRPMAEISAQELLAVLRKIESRGALETAKRARQTCSQIFRYAIATGRAERDTAADLVGALKTPQKQHYAAITDPAEVGQLMNAIANYDGGVVVATALKLSPLLFCRPGELRHMEWDEINWQEAIWEIPAEKMKMGHPHIVPLSKQALAILTEYKELYQRGKYVFPSARGASRPLSDNGVRVAANNGLRQPDHDAPRLPSYGTHLVG